MINKISFVFIAVFIGTSLASFSQNTKKRTFSVSALELNVGLDQDHYRSMSLNQLRGFAQDAGELNRDLTGMTEEVNLTATGAYSSFGLRLQKNEIKNASHLQNQALFIRLIFHSPKESMVSYKNEDLDTSLVFCNLHKQISTDIAYTWEYSLGKKSKWNVYFGTGWSGGISYSNEMLVISGQYFGEGEHPSSQVSFEENTLKFDARTIAFNRLYIPYGIHYQLKPNVSIGIDGKRGIGFQSIIGGPSHFLKRTGQFGIGVKVSVDR
jgi:hypothetical protein